MTNGQLLVNIMHDKGITKVALSKLLNLSRQGLENKILGKREFKQSEINKISECLELSSEHKCAIFFAL